MEPVTCKSAYYVKLGRKGVWEESSIKKNIIRIGWPKQSLRDINGGRWERILKQLEKEAADKGAATRDCRALQMLCHSRSDDIWITFHANHLWWCKVIDASRIHQDTVSKYRRVARWHCQNIFGEPLLISELPWKTPGIQRHDLQRHRGG